MTVMFSCNSCFLLHSTLTKTYLELVKLSHFFRELTSTTLNVEKLTVMEGNIPVLLCKLEQIFLPNFFDSMEHLPIHLPYEARVSGLVQYCWMYSFERHPDKIETRTRIPHNVDSGDGSSSTPPISIFNYPGRLGGKVITYFLDQVNLEATHLYVLLNYEHVQLELNPRALDVEVDRVVKISYIVQAICMLTLFGMNSINYGIYVQGTNDQLEFDFYGNFFDIIQLEYTRTKVHNKYEIVEIRASRRYNKAYDPFIFAQQAKQVYYTPYPERYHGWLVVINTKVRSRIIHNILPQTKQEALYQDDDFVGIQIVFHIDPYVIIKSLVDIHGGGEEIDRQLLDQT
ncbi:hypothetical protein CR513_47363, partial [Mucuna pruriens]